jgi:PAS domain-containing protein
VRHEHVVRWRSWLWAGRQILTVVVVLILILMVTTGTIITQLRNHELTAAGNQLKGLAVILADQAERAFEAVELIEISIVEKLQNDGVSTPDEFRRWMEGRAVHEQLRNRIAGLPQVDALIAVDADGNVRNFSRFWPIPTVNVADRDYFKALKDGAGPVSFVARPVQNRSNNSWNIYIARKFVSADGAMLGLIVGAINLNYLERLYGAAAPQPDGAVALLRNDGVLLARHPHVEPRIGDSFSGRPIFQGIEDPGAQEEIIHQTSLIDGMDRLYARRLLQHFPIMLNVSNTEASILQAWRQEAASLGGAAILLGALIVAAALMLLRMVHGQRRLHQVQVSEAASEAARLNAESLLRLSNERAAAERAMHLQNERFGVAMSNMSHALGMFDVDDRLVVANQRLYELLDLREAAVPSGTTFEALFRLASDAGLPTRGVEQLVNILRRLKAAGARADEGCMFGARGQLPASRRERVARGHRGRHRAPQRRSPDPAYGASRRADRPAEPRAVP